MIDSKGYSVVFPLFIFLLLDAVMVINSLRLGKETNIGKRFFLFISCTTVLQLATLVTYSNDLGLIALGIVTQTITNVIGVVLLTAVGYLWTLYVLETSPALIKWTSPTRKFLLGIPIILLIVMTVSSYWTHWIFYIDENGVYHNGTKMYFQLMSYLYYLFAIIVYFTGTRNSGESGAIFKRFSTFMIPGLLGGMANLFIYRGGYAQIGVSVGAILMYMEQFMVEINEAKRLRSVAAVNEQLVKANEEIKSARDAAFEASQAKTNFLFNMSHDIRTPMNAILGCADIARQHFDDSDKVKECLDKIMSSGNHLLNLLNDILEMSRIESGHMKLTEAPVDMLRAIDTVGNMAKTLAASNNINLSVTVGEFQTRYIYADELHVNEVILNLLSNAVKYSRPGGNVEYRVEQAGLTEDGIMNVRFEIRDDGIGMSEEFQKRMFEAFSRENTSTVSKIQGTGLGLSIVKNIVDMLGGKIGVQSKLNEGTVFVITIPFMIMDDAAAEEFAAGAQGETAPAEQPASGRRLRLLYAEDNELNREIGTELLAGAGIDAETAEDGSEAVKIISEKGLSYYDAVLMDIQMPVMNGYEAARAIRAMSGGESIPIIALSANAFAEDVQQSLSAGMNAHIAKPIKMDELLRTLNEFTRS